MIVGARRPDDTEPHELKPGDYAFTHGAWYCCVPNGQFGNLGAHIVEEHDDGTITVAPSIKITEPGTGRSWHGWLVEGRWRAAE